MTRSAAIAAAEKYFDGGAFLADLGRRVAIPTESQNPARAAELAAYLETEMSESLARMGMTSRVLPNPTGAPSPFLVAELMEDPQRPTVAALRPRRRDPRPGRRVARRARSLVCHC